MLKPGRLYSFVAGVDMLDPDVPVEVKQAALGELMVDPIGAMKKNPPEYQALYKKLRATPGYGIDFL